MRKPVPEPTDPPKFSFSEDYGRLQRKRDDLESEIRSLKEAIAEERDSFASGYDRLVCEQQEITDEKCIETNELSATIQRTKCEIRDIKAVADSSEHIDESLRSITADCDEVEEQERIFINELSRYTRALIDLGSSSATTGSELLLGGTRVPKFRSATHREAARLAQSLYSLRMVLVKRYAESIDSGCGVQ